MSAYTDYINAWSKAEFYSILARGYIETHLTGVEALLTELTADLREALANLPEWNFTATGTSEELQNLLEIAKTAIPSKPSGLGTFSIADAPGYIPSDTTILKEALQQILNVVSVLPSRLTQSLNLADALYSKIYTDLVDGGYGIETEDEEALWARVRDRELKAASTMIDDMKSKSAALGYAIPPGTLVEGIQQAINKAHDNLSEANRDISIKRADLYRDTRKFTIEQAGNLSKYLFDLTNSKVTMLKNISDAQIEEAKLTIEGFKAEVDEFKASLEKATEEQRLLAELWKVDIEGWVKKIEAPAHALQIITQADQQALEAIKAKYSYAADRLKLYQDTWKTQVDAVLEKVRQSVKVLGTASAAAFDTINGVFGKMETEEI